MSLVVADGLTKSYQTGEVEVKALRGLDFAIEKGTLVSFIGPSGSGKTPILNLIGCLDKPTGGSLLVGKVDVSSLSRKDGARFRGQNIGFIFQNFNLIPVMTVYENVEYPLVMVQKRPTSERRERISSLLESVGMADQRNKLPDQLSGGQKQRVAIARALVTNPELVLADEPTANLDHDSAYTIINLMKRMKDELDTTFIFSTHDTRIIGEVEILYTLEDGKLVGRQELGRENHD